jgi:hypothetical protein
MNLALRLALYVGITAGLVGGLASGVWWLVTPDASLRLPVEAKAAPVPPRIADSLARKMPAPIPEPQPERAVAPSPPLHEAPVSLTTPGAEKKAAHRAVKVTRGSRLPKKEPPVTQTYVVRAVTTARTDAPY